jgi:class 3 adenylate cyclase
MEKRVSSLSQGQRILAAIMMTDAVGFSKRMSTDEGLTLRLIDRDLTLIAETCSDYGGTVLKSTGDGLLIYFISAVEAVSCGLEIQQKLVDLATDAPPDQYLDHRIGIHLGDILVREQDVMGNGVNITARLQTYAKSRGLCVSQAIYDVVKARLTLNSTFLGPLQLKNIQEPVPAYQISLQPEEAVDPNLSVADEPTCTLPMATEVLLAIAVRTLITHSYSKRIKKLAFAAYQQAWENDSEVLNQFDLRSLLISLRERYPNLNELEYQFQRIVMGLNRQALYQDVATIILETLQPWYSRSIVSQSDPNSTEQLEAIHPSLEQQCQQVAQQLSQDEAHELRIRKLLYCLCQHHWENDPDRLRQIDLAALIHQSLQVAPQKKDLRYHLERIVKRINRRKSYTQVANDVMAAFRVLYGSQQGQPQPSGEKVSNSGTHLADGNRGSGGVSSCEETRLYSTPLMDDDSGPHQGSETCLGLPLSRDENGNLTTLHSSLSNPLDEGHAPATNPENQRPKRSRASLFDLRIEILQYTNPLRAKILLHSCLHGPFGYTSQDWYNLRLHTLDDLLQQTFKYCPTFSDLASKLAIIAHCLDSNHENAQVASTIALAMKAYYPEDPDAPLASSDLDDPQDQRQPQPLSRSPKEPSAPPALSRSAGTHSALSPT